MFRPLVAAALAASLAGCASTGGGEVSGGLTPTERMAYDHWHRLADSYEELIALCQANQDPCTDEFAGMDRLMAQAEQEIAHATIAGDRAFAASDSSTNRSSARGTALMAIGAGILSQPRPMICNTSDTTNPTTVCQ